MSKTVGNTSTFTIIYSLSIDTKIDDLVWSWTAIRSNSGVISRFWDATMAKRMMIDTYQHWTLLPCSDRVYVCPVRWAYREARAWGYGDSRSQHSWILISPRSMCRKNFACAAAAQCRAVKKCRLATSIMCDMGASNGFVLLLFQKPIFAYLRMIS